MSTDNKNLGHLVINKIWPKMVVVWNFWCEYIGDYCSGNKYKRMSDLNDMNQKQK